MNTRPYNPEQLKTALANAASHYVGQPVSDIERRILAKALTQVMRENTPRYEVCQWLTGHASTKTMPPAMVKAMMKMLNVQSFNDAPDPRAAQELHQAHAAALKAAGQMELLP